METLKEKVKALDLVSYNKTQICVKLSKIPTDILIQIEKRTENCRDKISERIYWIYNDITEYPICPECGKLFKPRFHGWAQGYKEQVFCSKSCLNKSDYHKELCCSNRLEKTGYAYSLQNPSHQALLKSLCQEAHGVDHYFQSAQVKESIKVTNLERYGVEYSVQNPEIFEKSQRHRTKTGVLPSGREINYQGYEMIVILELLKTYSEEEIVLGRKDIPKFWYIQDGKKHIYFADIYIPSKNLIIEVKSEWTWKKYLEKNLLKQQSVLDAGFNNEIHFCDSTELIKIERNSVQSPQSVL